MVIENTQIIMVTSAIPGLFFLIWQGEQQSLLANLAIPSMHLVKGILAFQQLDNAVPLLRDRSAIRIRQT